MGAVAVGRWSSGMPLIGLIHRSKRNFMIREIVCA